MFLMNDFFSITCFVAASIFLLGAYFVPQKYKLNLLFTFGIHISTGLSFCLVLLPTLTTSVTYLTLMIASLFWKTCIDYSIRLERRTI